MLDELSRSLPRFRSYEENLPMNKALERALLDVYTEMICFCARTIYSTSQLDFIKLTGWHCTSSEVPYTVSFSATCSLASLY